MTDLVDDGVLDLANEFVPVAALLEKRPAVDDDAVGQDVAIAPPALGQGKPLVDAEQRVGRRGRARPRTRSSSVGSSSTTTATLSRKPATCGGQAIERRGDDSLELLAAHSHHRGMIRGVGRWVREETWSVRSRRSVWWSSSVSPSSSRRTARAVRWRTVLWGLGLQVALAVIIIKTPWGFDGVQLPRHAGEEVPRLLRRGRALRLRREVHRPLLRLQGAADDHLRLVGDDAALLLRRAAAGGRGDRLGDDEDRWAPRAPSRCAAPPTSSSARPRRRCSSGPTCRDADAVGAARGDGRRLRARSPPA